MTTRRNILRSGMLAGSFAIVPLSVSGESDEPDTYRGHPVPFDISVTNNTESVKNIIVRIYNTGSESPVLTSTYPLKGLNSPENPPLEEVKFKGKFDAFNTEGIYRIEASIPGGSTDSSEVRMVNGSVMNDQYVTVSAYPDSTVKVDTYFSCK
ncbi:hypothetical protein [Haladaptatus cibarius]|uniref:hypothetical protein n=1 Tax=Haladaptatus cibarius TaxID=453847 RepID=UPI001185E39E|nr:hypothetical protein [Haladaptatus cibarius]